MKLKLTGKIIICLCLASPALSFAADCNATFSDTSQKFEGMNEMLAVTNISLECTQKTGTQEETPENIQCVADGLANLANQGNNSAKEQLAYHYCTIGKMEEAKQLVSSIIDDPNAPDYMKERNQARLEALSQP